MVIMYKNQSISSLSHEELSKAMKELHISVGPITSSTRRIYENRLKSHLNAESKKSDLTESENNKMRDDRPTDEQCNGVVEKPNDSHAVNECSSVTNNDTGCDKYDDKPCGEENALTINAEECTVYRDSSYYGVWIPYSPSRVANKNNPTVFRCQKDALKVMKGYKGSRFKSFKSLDEAEQFSITTPITLSVDKMCAFVSSNTIQAQESNKTVLKAPTFRELMQFRKHIENDNLQSVQKCLSNPRYLISSGDMPVILQEGARMNALHIAVKFNKLHMCEFVLKIIQSTDFLKLMYPESPLDNLEFRKEHLVDLYLNTPDKILCDSPLHIASKFGFTDIVSFLLTFQKLSIHSKNKDGKTSQQVICTRVNARGEQRQKIKNDIEILFQEKAYIPLYDMETQSKVGDPILTVAPNAFELSSKKVKAYVGPVSPDKASSLFQLWKKSPRDKLYVQIAKTDYEKGMERIGRSIASKQNVPFNEFWHFLGTFADLSSEAGLLKLENYLKNRSEHDQTSGNNPVQRLSLSAPKKYYQTRLTSEPDEIKRKLSFENTNPVKDNLNISENIAGHSKFEHDTNNIKIREYSRKLFRSPSERKRSTEECYCSCGELLEYCDRCTISINMETLSVSFTTCTPANNILANISTNLETENEDADNCFADGDADSSLDSPDNSIFNQSSENTFPESALGYINGDLPSKHDLDVLRAIKDVDLEPLQYPYIECWKKLVESFPDVTKTSWPSPGSPRYAKTLKRTALWTA